MTRFVEAIFRFEISFLLNASIPILSIFSEIFKSVIALLLNALSQIDVTWSQIKIELILFA